MARSLYAMLHRRFGVRSADERVRRARLMDERAPRFVPPAVADRSALPLAGKKVAVIGAGLAGLAAALELVERWGATVEVYEARKRTSGRVYSLEDIVPGRVTEAGAELIGLNHRKWIELAHRFGLGLSSLTPEDDYAAQGLEMRISLEKGKVLTAAELKELYDEMDGVLHRITEESYVVTDTNQPWKAYRADYLDNLSVEQWLDQLVPKPSSRCVAALRVMLENDNVAPLSEQSYLGLLALVAGGGHDAYWTDSEVFRCENGNESLTVRLRESIENSATGSIRTSAPVTALDVRAGGSVLVHSAAGKLSYDYAVLAIPPSTWPQLPVTPKIPAEMTMSTGPAVKYLLPVKERFWIQKKYAPSGASTSMGQVWESTDNQMVVSGQGIGLNIFAGGATAQQAIDWALKHGENQMAEYYNPLLEELYGEDFPSFVAGTGKFMGWPWDNWTRCGYSCPRPGQVCTVGPFLNEMYEKRLAFAGEHTCMAFFGYMEGALQSGYRAAERIATAAGVVKLGALEGVAATPGA
ncbi:MAG TPA: NAD(P)/FAD-dependent oxidoreductase [Longimicrobiaceae bacterium]|nr:NAD(P)/FAD-dependent oxidoreductase [Longimicrobiaceae bacterium]